MYTFIALHCSDHFNYFPQKSLLCLFICFVCCICAYNYIWYLRGVCIITVYSRFSLLFQWKLISCNVYLYEERKINEFVNEKIMWKFAQYKNNLNDNNEKQTIIMIKIIIIEKQSANFLIDLIGCSNNTWTQMHVEKIAFEFACRY